jgi:hypothetical protein
MKKVFISQPMKGRAQEDILKEREELIAKVGPDVEVLDSHFKDFDGNALAFLGKAIGVLAQADIVAFGKGWEEARGCKIEHACAKEYGLEIILLD